jgi:hypothetical protein
VPSAVSAEITFRLSDFFRPGSHKVALEKGAEAKQAASVPQLIADTNDFSTKNRPGCQPTLLKSDPKALFLNYNVKCKLKTSDPNGHDVKIRFDIPEGLDEKKATDLDVKVSCTCPAFLYWGGQFNSWERDSLEGEPRPLLTAPTERLDLRGDFVICKHIAAVSERILPSVQHNINNITRSLQVQKNNEKEQPASKKRETLEEKQEKMRKRLQLDKERKRRNKQIQKKLLNDVKRREEKIPLPNVVERDTPSTPEERSRTPKITPDVLTPPSAPTPAAPPPPPPSPPVQKQLGKDAIVPRDEEATTGSPVPQKMPRMTQNDRKQMDSLLADENLDDLEDEV